MSTSSVPSWGFFPGSCGQVLAEPLFYFEDKNMAARKLWCQEHEVVAVSSFLGRKQRKHWCLDLFFILQLVVPPRLAQYLNSVTDTPIALSPR